MDLIRVLIVYMALLSAQGAATDVISMPVNQPTPAAQATAVVTPVPTATPAPTPTPTKVPTYYASLSEGSRGDKVKALQQALIDLGYLTGRADGSFGTMTRNAVIDFQKANGLIADGIAGSATQWLLYEGDPARKEEATPTPAPQAAQTVFAPAAVRVRYQDQFGVAFWETEMQITRTQIITPDDSLVPEGFTLTGEDRVQVLYTQGKAYPAVVTFLYHSPHIPEEIEVPVRYVTFDHGEKEVLYASSVIVRTGSFAAVRADLSLLPGYRLKSASVVTIVADEEANIAPACAEFVFTAQ